MDLMEFLETNYVWIIVVSVIVIMTVIGFIADKHDFGNDAKKNKKDNKKDDVYNNQDIDDKTNVELNNNFDSNFETVNIDTPVPEPFIPNEQLNQESSDDLYAGFGDMDNSFISNETSTQTEASLEENDNVDNTVSASNLTDSISFDEDLPADNISDLGVNNQVNEASENNTSIQDQNQNLGMELPSIETLNEEIADVEADEDVWKF